jgi:hypothetical protein
VGFSRVLVGLGGVFHRVPGQFVSSLVISLAVMRSGDAVSVRGEVMELGGPLVPVISAFPAMTPSITPIAHESFLQKIRLNCTTPHTPAARAPLFQPTLLNHGN